MKPLYEVEEAHLKKILKYLLETDRADYERVGDMFPSVECLEKLINSEEQDEFSGACPMCGSSDLEWEMDGFDQDEAWTCISCNHEFSTYSQRYIY